MPEGRAIRLCVGASAGGHTTELEALLDHAATWPVAPTSCVTTLEMLRGRFEAIAPTTVIGESNREKSLSLTAAPWVVRRPRLPDHQSITSALSISQINSE